MRLDIHPRNRLGITYEVLEVFARHKTDIRAIDMVTHHINVVSPDFTDGLLHRLTQDLVTFPGISKVQKPTPYGSIVVLQSREAARQYNFCA